METVAMARPPPKRRKLSNYAHEAPGAEHRIEGSSEDRATVEDRPQTYAHVVEPLEEAQLVQHAVGGIEGHRMLLPRQDTAMSSVPTSSLATSTLAGSSTSTSNTTPDSVATTASPDLALSLSLSLSASLGLSGIPGVVTGLPGSAVSGLVSDVSGLLAPSEAPSTSSSSLPTETANTPSIGSAPNDTSSAPRTSGTLSDTSSAPINSSANDTSSPLSTSSGNDTTPISGTSAATSTSEDGTTTSSLLSSSTGPAFLTSSFSRNSTTPAESSTGSSTTTNQASIQTSSLSGSDSSSLSETALIFIATLSQGDVTTLSRSDDSYTTTFDGNTFTVAAVSTTFSSAASRTTGSLSDSVSSGGTQTGSSATTTDGGSSGAGQYTPAAPTSTGSGSSGNSTSSSTPPAGTIAGGVVGGAAGLAVVVLIAMLAVRWYRRKGMARHQALPQGPVNSPDPNAPAASGGPGMAERAGLAPFVAAVPALFRHQNRSAEGEETGQRGFTRVSGRKLPSAFSGGLSIQPPPNAPVTRDADGDLNGTSFYRDSSGFYGGDGTTGSPSSPTGSIPPRSNSHEHMTISPGPQRMPKLHAGGPYNMSPVGSAGPSSPHAASTLTRSDAPFLLDPNRNSRFSEGL